MASGTRVYDCFTFAGELDLLAFRLELLGDVVDHFVLVEASRTHSGIPKELVFSASRGRFHAYLDRIIHVVVDDLPLPEPDRWVPERFQRRAVVRGLADAELSDIAIVTDVDEIPDPEIVCELKKAMPDRVGLEMRTCYQRANWESTQIWPLARAVRVGTLSDAEELRRAEPFLWIKDAGAHLTYLMEPSQIAKKYATFAHSEYDTPRERSTDYLRLCRSMAMVPHSAELLRIRDRLGLGAVQAALLDRRPDLFDFRTRPDALRHVAQHWARLRRRSALPLGLSLAGDRMLRSLMSGASHLWHSSRREATVGS